MRLLSIEVQTSKAAVSTRTANYYLNIRVEYKILYCKLKIKKQVFLSSWLSGCSVTLGGAPGSVCV